MLLITSIIFFTHSNICYSFNGKNNNLDLQAKISSSEENRLEITEMCKTLASANLFFIAPAFSKVRYRGSTFFPFVRPSVHPQFASSLENLPRVWE